MQKQTQRIERLHKLMERNATGTPKECAQRLGISERQLYNTLELMRGMGAPIIYNTHSNTYLYEYEVDWKIGFSKKLSQDRMSEIQGDGLYQKIISLQF